MSDVSLEPALVQPGGFRSGKMPGFTAPGDRVWPVPGLGPLRAFTGTFEGGGSSTIFRPGPGAPAQLPVPVTGSDNWLIRRGAHRCARFGKGGSPT